MNRSATIVSIREGWLLLVVLLLLLFSEFSSAGMKIEPAFIRMDKAAQGKSYFVPISITNTSLEQMEHLKVYTETRGKQVNGISAGEVLSWATVEPSSLSVRPGETKRTKFRVTIPTTTEGDYRLYIAIEQDGRRRRQEIENQQKMALALGSSQLGKDYHSSPKEITRTINTLLKITVPVVLRVLEPGVSPVLNAGEVRVGEIAATPGAAENEAMALQVPVENLAAYDVDVTGVCTIYDSSGKKKLKVSKVSRTNSTVQPKNKSNVTCPYRTPLASGEYRVALQIAVNISGSNQTTPIKLRRKLTIDDLLASKMRNSVMGGHGAQDRPVTPLFLDPPVVEERFRGSKPKSISIDVNNPTRKTLHLRSMFQSASKKFPVKSTVKPKRLTLEAGATKKIMLSVVPKKRNQPVFGWLRVVAKETAGSLPAAVPIVLTPEQYKLQERARMTDLQASLSKDGKYLGFSSLVENSTRGQPIFHLQGTALITGIAGSEQSHKITITPTTPILLPGEQARISGAQRFSELEDGIYDLTLKSDGDGVSQLSIKSQIKVDRESEERVTLVQ